MKKKQLIRVALLVTAALRWVYMKKKKFIYLLICVVSFVFTTCIGDGYEEEKNEPGSGKPYTKESIEKIWEQIDGFVESDVPISGERPLPDAMSEKEALVRAYSIMSKRGNFSPDNYMFSNAPVLLTAKVARPLTVHIFGSNDGLAWISYRLYAVAENGEVLIEMPMSAAASLSDSELLNGGHSGYGHTDGEFAYHYITETELIELVESQFDKEPDERPIIVLLKLAGHPYSRSVLFWYFTVDDVEYIVAVMVFNWNSVAAAGGVSNHAAISRTGGNGEGVIGGERMARLDTRADFYKVIRESRDTAVENSFLYTPPAKEFQWTAIPLK
jgi:hypothetical protein